MKYPGKFSPTIGIIIILSLLGSLMIFYSTYWGPWAYSDSAGYLAAARNLLHGHGLGYFGASGDFMPLSIHPPFYSLVLSGMGLFGLDVIVAARWLNIILFGATILLSGTFAYSTFHSSWLALSLSASLLTMPSFVDVSSGAMSELLFFFTTILGICLLIVYLDQGKRYLLILSSLAIGMAFLCRINGVVVVVAGIIGLMVINRISWKQRIIDTLVFSLISLTPILSWLIWVYSQTKTIAARDFFFTPHIWSATTELRINIMEVFWSWLPFPQLLPPYSYHLSRNVFILLFAILFLSVLLIVIKQFISRKSIFSSPQEFSFALFWIVFILGNILLLAASFIFIDLVPSTDSRTFFYIQFGLIIAFLALFSALIKVFRFPPAIGWIYASVFLIFDLSYSLTSWNIINQYHLHGAGYTSEAWQKSLTLKTLRALPPDVPIITNQAAAVLLLLDRPAYDFCTLPCNQTGQFTYGDDPTDPVQGIFREDGAALVLFYGYCDFESYPWYANIIAEVKSLTQNLKISFSSCDGKIFFYP